MASKSADPIRLVLVEDSPTVQVFMTELLRELGFVVLGCAANVATAVTMVRIENPDLVVADVRLPDGDGIQLARLLLQERGVPIVLVTGYDAQDPRLIFEAERAGALEVLPKPPGRSHPDHERLKQHLGRIIRTLAGVRIMTRRPDRPTRSASLVANPGRGEMRAPAGELIVAVGASTGGPIVLAEILKALSGRRFAFAMVIQHLVPEFIEGFGAWLENQIEVPVRLAAHDLLPEQGVAYIAPPHSQIQIETHGRFRVVSSTVMPTTHVPSIDAAFFSLARFRPLQTTAILLTGMGRDGADGLLALREKKAFTIAQTPESAVLASMPEHAIALGAATTTLGPEDIRELLGRQLDTKP